MPPKTAQQIQDEADRLFGKGASQQKFEWRRAQQAEAGLEQETKKRGGVAGAYDRNKKLVSAAATAAGYLMGGPMGAGLARGAMQGLDRPGEGGIGFDVRRGVKGFSEGYGAGNVANIGKMGMQRLLTSGGGTAAATPTAMSAVNEVAGPGETVATVGYGQPVGTAGAGRGVRVPELTDKNILEMARGTPAGQAIRNQINRASSIIGEQTIRGTPGAIGADTITQYGSAQRIPLFSSQAVMPPTSTPAIAGAQTPMRAMTQPRMTDTFRLGPNQMAQPITGVPAAAQGRTPVGPGVIPRVPTSAQMPLPPAGGAGIGGKVAAGARTMSSLLGGGTGQDGQGGIDWRGLLTNPQVIAGLTGGVSDVMGQRSQQAVQEAQLAQQAEQFRQRFGAEEEERKRRIAQENRLASFFMPAARG